MFQQLIASNAPKTHRKPLTWALSAAVHGFLALLLIAFPLVHPETLANLQALVAPPPPLSAPRRPIVQLMSSTDKLMSSTRKPRSVTVPPNTLLKQGLTPPKIDVPALETPEGIEAPDGILQVGLRIGDSRGSGTFWDGFSLEAPRAILPLKPPASNAGTEAPVARIQRGGVVQHANLLHQVKPTYPPLARSVRVQGAVVLEALIDREGRVENLKVLSGHPLLIPAAFEAVQQWKYRPTLLNGQPVEVLTQVTVNFSLGTP